MSEHDTWEDEGGSLPEEIDEDWPFDENGDWIETELLDDWDNIDEIDDYKYVEGETT